MFKYGNYIAKLEVNADAGILYGRVLNISDVVVFEGTTVKEAEEDFYRAVDAYIQACREQGKEPDKPFSGKLPFRTTPEIHRDIYIAATRADKSINAWMEEILSEEARQAEQPSSATTMNRQEFEVSIAQYEALLTQLQQKITQLQNAIQPYLGQKPGSFMRLFHEIKPLLKDRELPDLLEKVDALKERITIIQSRDEAFLYEMAKTAEEPAVEQSESVAHKTA
ncbi:MAG: type II toxin-antitoxin system HicB family antitoxin [Cyanobacteria bacterium RM1_2_2]|nr:type II toxin-antitoxin system HicB family antitoxin [Cyanobacteria bacterium RM1_2_2]